MPRTTEYVPNRPVVSLPMHANASYNMVRVKHDFRSNWQDLTVRRRTQNNHVAHRVVQGISMLTKEVRDMASDISYF